MVAKNEGLRILASMFEALRQKIKENRLAEALHGMDELPLSREHHSRLVNLHRRFRVYQDKAIGNLVEDRLLRIEENGIVEDMLMFLDMVEFPAQEEGGAPAAPDLQVTITKSGGAAAGARKERNSKGRWLPLGLGLLVLAALAAWWLWPAEEVPVGRAEVTTQESPAAPDAREDSPEETPPANPGTSRIPGGKLTIDPELLQRPELSRAKDLTIDPSVLSRTLLPALMTPGDQIDIAVAVYRNRKAPTQYDATLSKSFATYLDQQFPEVIGYEVLTEAFHDLEGRERLQLRGTLEDNRLSAKRARYLLLVDIRNLTVTNKAEYRLCLYDIARQRGTTKGASVDLGSWTSIRQKDMLYKARDFLKDRKERGILQ